MTRGAAQQPGKAAFHENRTLTPHQIRIVELVAEGLNNTEIAERLHMAKRTVKFHLSEIYRKMGWQGGTAGRCKLVKWMLLRENWKGAHAE